MTKACVKSYLSFAMLLMTTAPVIADEDRSLRFMEFARQIQVTGDAAALDVLSTADRRQMSGYIRQAYRDLAARNLEVTGRLGCNGGRPQPRSAELRHVLGEIYKNHIRRASDRFLLLYGAEASAVLGLVEDESSIHELVSQDLDHCSSLQLAVNHT